MLQQCHHRLVSFCSNDFVDDAALVVYHVSQGTAGEAAFRVKFSLVPDNKIYMSMIRRDAFHHLQYRCLRTFEVLAEVSAIEYQYAGNVKVCIAMTRRSDNVHCAIGVSAICECAGVKQFI